MALFVDNGMPLVDFGQAAEIACSGLGRVEFMEHGQACLVFYRNGLAAGSGTRERQLCGRVFMPLAACPELTDLVLKAMLEGGLVSAARLSRHLLS